MYERNGNDSTQVRQSVKGHVVYFKYDYGFIKPDDRTFDDLLFHVNDVEPWREGFVEFKGRVKEQIVHNAMGQEVMIPYYEGERVKFDIKDSNKKIKDKITGLMKKAYKAINIEILSEYKSTTFTRK